MGVVTEEAVYKRLRDVNSPSQETVETISMWIMHHKDKVSIEIVVDCWLKCFKTAPTDQHRIALFYVMNHVVQQARHKHVDAFIPAFQPAVLSAVDIGRNYELVKKVMDRCISLFGDRQIFTHESVTTMKNKLNAEEIGDSCVDLDCQDVIRRLRNFIETRRLASDGMKVFKNADFDFRSKIKNNVRNKPEAETLRKTAQSSLGLVVSLRKALEGSKKKMMEVVETLELAKQMYAQQLLDVTIMEAAYQQFLHGIRDVNKELQEMERLSIYPGATPPRDAPSPTANDDIYATGVEHVLQNFRTPGVSDNLEATDMEIEEDERVPASSRDNMFSTSIPSTSQVGVHVPFSFQSPPNFPPGAGQWLPPPSTLPPKMPLRFPMDPAQFTRPPPIIHSQSLASTVIHPPEKNALAEPWVQSRNSSIGEDNERSRDVGGYRRRSSSGEKRNSYYDPRSKNNRDGGYGRERGHSHRGTDGPYNN